MENKIKEHLAYSLEIFFTIFSLMGVSFKTLRSKYIKEWNAKCAQILELRWE